VTDKKQTASHAAEDMFVREDIFFSSLNLHCTADIPQILHFDFVDVNLLRLLFRRAIF
jgi:hypothetical protein